MRPSMPTRNLARRRLVRLRAGGLAAGDERRARGRAGARRRRREEAAVERELARAQVERGPARRPVAGQQVGLVGRADLAGGRDDQAARAAAGVLAQLGELDRRSRTRSAARSLPLRIGRASGSVIETSRSVIFSPAEALADLARDLAGALGQLLQPPRGGELGAGRRDRGRARAAARRAGAPRGPSARPAAPASPVSRSAGRLALAGARRQRPVEPAQPPADRRASGPRPAARRAGELDDRGGLARERLRRVGRQPESVG